jgi:ParB-like chromosome segregation protein Spo0J
VSTWQLDSDEEAYTIIAGERRWRAFVQLAQQDPADFGRIPATVMHVVGDDREAQVLMGAIIENVVREDLKESEKAAAMRQLREWTGWTFEAIADRMGLSVHRVLELAAIARHDAVIEAVDGRLTKKQAIAIGQAGVDSEAPRRWRVRRRTLIQRSCGRSRSRRPKLTPQCRQRHECKPPAPPSWSGIALSSGVRPIRCALRTVVSRRLRGTWSCSATPRSEHSGRV